MTSKTPAHLATAALGLLGVTLALTTLGCETIPEERPEEEKPQFVQEISKEELLYRIQLNVQNLASLQAPAEVTATDLKMVGPVSAADELKRRQGKPYQQGFVSRKLDGYIMFERRPPNHRIQNRLRFYAEVTGVGRVVELLALDDVFVIKQAKPTSERKLGSYPFTVYKGRFDSGESRPKDGFTMRPQDLMDLFLCRELLASFSLEKVKATFVEVWPDYYIVNVLRVDPDRESPVQLYSKIWVERHTLMVAIHQLYEPTGEMVAEARFTNYVKVVSEADEIVVPRHTRFIWPRDKVTIDVLLRADKIRVNYEVTEKAWTPPKESDSDVIEVTRGTKGYQFTPVTEETAEDPR